VACDCNGVAIGELAAGLAAVLTLDSDEICHIIRYIPKYSIV